MLATKFFTSSTMKIKKHLVTKHLSAKTQQLLSKRIRHRLPFAYVLLVFSYMTASKISLIYVQGCEKRNPTQIHKHGPKIRSENLNSRNLDRYLDRQYMSSLIKPRQIAICRVAVELSVHRYQAICPTLVNNFFSLVHLFLGPILLALILDLNNMFLKVLNSSQIYQNRSKDRKSTRLNSSHSEISRMPSSA